MSTVARTGLSPVHTSILDWSQSRPDWQRDALRRLVEQNSLDETDVDALVALCEQQCGLREPGAEELQAIPLERRHLPSVAETGEDVALESIADVRHVNALAGNQVLTFGQTGLTVIYGDNASGKSGYCRVLKRACRARNRGGKIMPDVYKDPPGDPAQATITFVSGDTRDTTTWIDGEDPALELSAASFFDADCAVVHVQQANDIAFTPFGLDVLERLVHTCDAVQTRLAAAKRQLESEQPASLRKPKCRPETAVGRVIAKLSRSIVFEQVAPLAVLTDDERNGIQQIRADLASDPVKASNELKAKRQRIDELRRAVKHAADVLSPEATRQLRELADVATAKEQAAHLASTELFVDDPLPNVGNSTWKALWEAAREYSASDAYPDNAFPVTEASARCVLCQQELGTEARARMTRFEEFVKDSTTQAARDARSAAASALLRMESLKLDRQSYQRVWDELKNENEELARVVRTAIVRLRQRQRRILTAYSDSQPQSWESLPEIPGTGEADFNGLLATMESREELLRDSEDPEHRTTLQKQLVELEDREWLATVLEDVENEIFRLGQIKKIEAAIRSTRTTEITKKNKALAADHVTNKLRDRFVDEVQQLHAEKVRVELAAVRGDRGASLYRVRFLRAPDAPVSAVLSEGENKCIALAAFFTELATSPSNSALVFDDPVSSLDHRWRTKVAERLVAEARVRQVIVFTHDIVLLHDLMDLADKHTIPTHHQRVSRTSSGTGTVHDELPAKAQGTKHRLDSHGKLARQARRLYENNDEEEAEKLVIDCYGELRATVELAIEQYVFCHVIVRYRDYIDTKHMNRVWVIEKSDCVFLKSLFDKCSDVTASHSKSAGRNYTPPAPRELEQDIDDLAQWIESINGRRKTST